jgi:hypothetical protein
MGVWVVLGMVAIHCDITDADDDIGVCQSDTARIIGVYGIDLERNLAASHTCLGRQ